MSRDTRQSKPTNRRISRVGLILEVSIILIGIYLILDGYISILVQIEEDWTYQFFRVVRSILGVWLIIVGAVALRHNLRGGIKPIAKPLEIKYKERETLIRLVFIFPLFLLISLGIFALVQYFGEILGLTPTIMISGTGFVRNTNEAIILQLVVLSVVLFVGFLLSNLIVMELRRSKKQKR